MISRNIKYRIVGFAFIASFLFFATAAVSAQNVRGSVVGISDNTEETLEFASVYWEGTNIGAMTDQNGEFSLAMVKGHERLIASSPGFVSDTIVVTDANRASMITFRLASHPDILREVVVVGNQRGNYNRLDGTVKGEMITFAGLTKMACCSLAESFENSASVTVGYSDAITGTRQIRMLGLAGVYTQMLDETRPIMRGLGSPYGLSYTPGMWLEGIQVSKGITSVTSGHEAISGQINLEYRKPTDDTPLFLNAYVDSDLRAELNAASSVKINDKLSTVILAHGSMDTRRSDHNKDGYLDMPLTKQLNVANRWLYAASNGMQLRAGVKFVTEERIGGTKDFKPKRDGRPSSVTDPYGSKIGNDNFNAYLKVAMPVGKYIYDEESEAVERSNFAVIADYNYFDTDSYFGMLKDYRGTQHSGYLNAMYSWTVSMDHKVIFGASATIDDYDERLRDGTINRAGATIGDFEMLYGRTEKEAGVYGEYTYSLGDRLTVMGGLRGDYNNHHGWFATPRAHLKYNILPKLVFRGSAGLGYRSANIFTDNLWIFATGRTLNFAGGSYDDIDLLEKSFTYGGSLSWNFRLGQDENASLSFDYYRSEFLRSIVVDQEYDTEHIQVYNGKKRGAYSNTYQIDFNWMPIRNFDVVVTFRYNESYVSLNRPDGSVEKVERPLTDRFKGLVNFQYATRYRRWVFDFTAQLNGPVRLPVTDGAPLSSAVKSDVYPMFYAQVTYKINNIITVYLGCENIGDYTQHHVIMGGDAPYTTAFNSSVIWGPLMGRKIYAGTRINF